WAESARSARSRACQAAEPCPPAPCGRSSRGNTRACPCRRRHADREASRLSQRTKAIAGSRRTKGGAWGLCYRLRAGKEEGGRTKDEAGRQIGRSVNNPK